MCDCLVSVDVDLTLVRDDLGPCGEQLLPCSSQCPEWFHRTAWGSDSLLREERLET